MAVAGRVAGSFLLQHAHEINSILSIWMLWKEMLHGAPPSSYHCSSALGIQRQAANISKKFFVITEQARQSPGRRSRGLNFYICICSSCRKNTHYQV